jgi:RimJ/RimL family protein N-acetyltransferase
VLHTLPDGTKILVRPIEAADKARLAVALGRLSQETIRRRFFAAKPRFTSGELRYLTEVDGHDHLALVAFPTDDPETIVAVARCVRLPEAPDTAEFAIVVGDALQGRGLGGMLAAELADAARAVGIRRFTATTLADNVAVQRLMDSFATRLEQRTQQGGVREVVAELPGPERLAA